MPKPLWRGLRPSNSQESPEPHKLPTSINPSRRFISHGLMRQIYSPNVLARSRDCVMKQFGDHVVTLRYDFVVRRGIFPPVGRVGRCWNIVMEN